TGRRLEQQCPVTAAHSSRIVHAHSSDAVLHGLLNHLQRAHDIHLGVKERILDGSSDINLRGIVADDGRPFTPKHPLEPTPLEVSLVKVRSRINITALTS